MPRLLKARIVNIIYDKDNKFISDKALDLSGADGSPADALFRIENGEGKTVIVQLLLQPIIPKAKIQGRPLHSFLRRGYDHGYILLEWALDNSNSTLVTGIAIEASTLEDEENGKTPSVRYYTFIHERTGRDDLDITAFPLSSTENSIFTVAPYEEFRKYLQQKRIRCYGGEQKENYIARLAEFGIYHSEWDTMVKMNAVEGGITKVTENYKTSSLLLEKYIIPCLMTDEKTSKETLDDMFQNYAKSYASKEDNIRLKGEVLNFIDRLKEYQPYIEKMFNANDERQKAINLFADHVYTLKKKLEQTTERRELLTETQNRETAKLNRIKAEMYSREYYTTKKRYDDAGIIEQEYRQNKQDADDRCSEYTIGLNVLNAALEYQSLCKYRSTEEAYRKELRALNEGTQEKEILNTKYSLLKSAENRKQKTDEEINAKTEEKKGYERRLVSSQKKAEDLRQQHDDENRTLNITKGDMESSKTRIEKGLGGLGRSVMMTLVGTYSEKDINYIRSDYDKKIQNATDGIAENMSKQHQLEEENESIFTKRLNLENDKKDCEGKRNALADRRTEYQKAYNDVIPVLEHLNLTELQLFTDVPVKTIEQRIVSVRAERDRAENTEKVYKEQLEYIENGQMHMPKLAVDYLKETGIPYQTGEHYLLKQVPEVREKLLSVNPLLAYSIVVDSDKEQTKLLADTAEAWIPSTFPVYTLKDVSDMMEGKWEKGTGKFISKYEKCYFNDVTGYTEDVWAKHETEVERIKTLKTQLVEWQKEQDTLERFNFPAGYKKGLDEQIVSADEKLGRLEEEIIGLETRKKEIKEAITELRKTEAEQRRLKSSLEADLKSFNEICEEMMRYEEIYQRAMNLNSLVKQLKNQYSNELKNSESLNELICACDIRITELGNKAVEYDDVIKELSGTPEAELLADDYPILLERYYINKKQYSDDRKRIEETIEETAREAKRIEGDLKRFNLDPEMYQSVEYSADKYKEIQEKLDKAEKDRAHAEDQLQKATSNKVRHENEMEQALHDLRRIPAELLQPSEIGENFDARMNECKRVLEETKSELEECRDAERKLENAVENSENKIAEYRYELEGYEPKLTDTDKKSQDLIVDIKERSIELGNCEKAAENFCTRNLVPLSKLQSIFEDTINCITDTLQDRSGNKYYNLYERVDDAIKVYNDKIQVFDIELRDVDDSLNQLVTNCCQRMARLHSNMDILVKKSLAPIYGKQRRMLEIDIPKAEDIISEDAADRIRQYIMEQVVKYIETIKSDKNTHREYLEIKRLLYCYIGRENVQVKVFHIGDTSESSYPIKWEDAPTDNSGGQLDCALIMLAFSILNYARSQTNHAAQDKTVLILDNPFAKMTAEHLVAPLFNMAKTLGIQLICTTHVTNAPVLNGFNNVFQVDFKTYAGARIREISMKLEKHTTLLERHIEYMHYKTEQMSLF